MYAYANGAWNSVKILIENGADIDDLGAEVPQNQTALMLAASSCNHQMIRYLIHHHADVNVANDDGVTAIMEAGDYASARILIANGADVNAEMIDGYGSSALMLAVEHRKLDVAALLLANGAKVNAKDSQGGTAMAYADNQPSMQWLLERYGGTKMALSPDLNERLLLAAQWGDCDEAVRLLDQGANVNAVDLYGVTALIFAAEIDSLKMVKLLVDRGADINAVGGGEQDKSALMIAAGKGDQQLIRFLILHHADVNEANADGSTALMDTVDAASARILIANGADVNAKTYVDGTTVLMCALTHNRLAVAALLLEKGAKVNDRDALGNTAMTDVADQPPAIRLLKAYGGIATAPPKGLDERLLSAVQAGDGRGVATLLREGAFVDAQDHDGNSALILAAEKRARKTVEILVDHGANVNALVGEVPQNQTALMVASASGDLKLIRYLIRHGANVNEGTNGNQTALMVASDVPSARILIENGADVNARTYEFGSTVLMIAVSNGRLPVAALLLEKGANVNDKNGQGETVMSFVDNQPAMIRLLKRYGEKD